MEHDSNSHTGQLISLDRIKIGTRHRRELGDITSLAVSIDDLGLLQPIVVTPDLELVSGQRRIHAVRSLGHDSIEAYIVHGLDEAASRLRAERDENTCRKDFTPTEEHALYEVLLELERPKAQERKAQAPGRPQGTKVSSGKFPGQTSEARKQAAATATGNPGRHKTLDKVGEVKQVALAPETPEPVRKVAEQALREMDNTGRVDGSYQRVKDAERVAAIPKMNPVIADALTDQHSEDLRYTHEFLKAFSRSDDFLRYEPERLARLLNDSEASLVYTFDASIQRFVKTFTTTRRGLRLINGSE